MTRARLLFHIFKADRFFMRSTINKLKKDVQFKESNHHPFVKGIYYAALTLCLVALFLGGFYFRTGLSPWLQVAVYLTAGLLAFWIFRWLGAWIASYFKKIPLVYFSIAIAFCITYYIAGEMRFSWPGVVENKSIFLGITSLSLFFGGLLSAFDKRPGRGFYIFLSLLGITLGYFSLAPILTAGEDPYQVNYEEFIPDNLPEFNLPDPNQEGTNTFQYFTYGSGSDERRPEFNSGIKYETASVDASLILPEWTGKRKKWRERYWGFGIDNAPLNGRVWLPNEGKNLPLILIVHGNHGMEHHSDPGYHYLGELLASRGFITVSVDENFINGTWSGDFRGREMPARAWFLLKHLEQWKKWSEDPNSELYQKADLNKVILMGHSRGGEAVSIAAAYNKLSHFPDNANVKFDFNFGIKGLVAIAPTDIRYFRRIELKDVSYLSIQGTYDADEASFYGLRQYQRVSFSDSTEHMKAGILIHKANHGQFNSIWGRRDFGEPYGWFLNTGALISGEEQRQAAKVFISAFAERIFKQKNYDPIFEQPYLVKDWLPKTAFLGNYQNANSNYLVDFEDGIDLISKSNATITAKDFEIWREEKLAMRGGDNQGTNAVILGWNTDSLPANPVYEIALNDSIKLKNNTDLIFSIGRGKDSKIKTEGNESIEVLVELITSEGTIEMKMADSKELAPLLDVKYMKLKQMNGSFGTTWELNMETVALPIDFVSDELFLKKLRFKFDNSSKGLIALDNIGLRNSIRSSTK